MPRTREFSRDEVLHRAMERFWAQGYDAVSMRDLLDVMQIGRQSLYDTFGDKHSLFLACLERYADAARARVLAPLRAADGGLMAIERHFVEGARSMTDGPRRACFMANTTMELAPHDPAVAAITSAFAHELHAAFLVALDRAGAMGQVAIDDPDAEAWRLVNATYGLGALSKAGAPPEVLERTAWRIVRSLQP
jgi:TetR/AcrR family transcriptional repressor of nem operon